jgi:glycosyltransferase-like protein
MESLKIALLTYSTKPRGGVVHTLNLAERLVLLNHRVHIYALSGGEGFFRPVGVPHTLIPCPVVAGEDIDDKVRRYIRIYSEYMASIREDYDIYHAQDCISANALFEIRSRGLIRFFVRTVHHIDDFTSESLIDCQLRSIVEPDYLIVVSRFWERELRSRYSLNSTLIYNGVDLERFRANEKASKEEAKGDFSLKGYNVMLSIGGIEPRKNALTALRAFGIASRYFKARGKRLVWLIGGGETLFDYRAYREGFFSEIKELGLRVGEDIIVLGAVPEDSMVKLYRAADVFVFPSIKEGWGLVVLEAMASGLPVIASGIEPMTDYLMDGENALLVSPMDHEGLAERIIGILEEAGLRDKLIRNGMKTVESYSWQKTALKHSEFYRGILEGIGRIKERT